MPTCRECKKGDSASMLTWMVDNGILITLVKRYCNYLYDSGRMVDGRTYENMRDFYKIPYKTFKEFKKNCPVGKIYHRQTKNGRKFCGGC